MNFWRQDFKNVILRVIVLNIITVSMLMAWDVNLWKIAVFMVAVSSITFFVVIDYFKLRNKLIIVNPDEHVDSTLRIASETLPYMRMGLNEDTAAKAAEIIKKISDVAAVAITDCEKVLAYTGAGSDHHKPGGPIITSATKQVIRTGEMMVVTSRRGLDCPVRGCPLETAVVAPLKFKGKVVGTVKLYQTKEQGALAPGVVKLAVGIAQLLGLQIELAELDRQAQLVTKAELDALHAQINPHFLFNTLNAIIMFSRTSPETSRRLMIRLASFLRQSLKRHGHYKTIKEEMEFVNTYLFLERARFREKLRISKDIDKDLFDYRVPVLTIQPLVENAIKHGILPKPEGGKVHISISKDNGEILVKVKDDGVGIDPERLKHVLTPGFGSGNGVGMSNVHERLKGLYGGKYGLRVKSERGKGTEVSFRVPAVRCDEDKDNNE